MTTPNIPLLRKVVEWVEEFPADVACDVLGFPRWGYGTLFAGSNTADDVERIAKELIKAYGGDAA